MSDYKGNCFCGEIAFSVKGEPLFTQCCHCNKCRDIASRSQRDSDKLGYAFTAAYLTAMFSITQGQEHLETVAKNTSDLLLCKNCGSLIYGISQDPDKQAGIGINVNNFDFVEQTLPESFRPDKHIWYQNRINNIDDHLPKYKDAPVEQFGSGKLISSE